MTLQNFSDGFDTQVNAYNRRQNFGEQDALAFDEYEKSLFLTKAQEETVLALYSGRNAQGKSFEETEELRRYLADLVKIESLSPISTSKGVPLGMSSTSRFFTLPEDLWFITYEVAEVSSDDCHDGDLLDVAPTTQDEYNRVKRNPFRGPTGRRALRLDLADKLVEIVSKYNVKKYYIRYIKELSPIVLTDLPDGLTVHNVRKATECGLHEALHERILERAVQLGIASKSVSSVGQQQQQGQ